MDIRIETSPTLSDREAVLAMITKGYATVVQDCIECIPHCIVGLIPTEIRDLVEYLADAEDNASGLN